jgi:hypothetical protein
LMIHDLTSHWFSTYSPSEVVLMQANFFLFPQDLRNRILSLVVGL